MSDSLKVARSKEKSAFTRVASKMKRFLAERSKDQVVETLESMKVQFEKFDAAHAAFHETMEEVVDIETSDNYVIEVEEKYAVVVSEANGWLASLIKDEADDSVLNRSGSVHPADQSFLTPEVLSVINLPKIELCSFDGDPLQYHSFVTTFDEMIDTVNSTGSAKLTRLVKATTGVARNAIQSCLIVGGEAGYKLARRTLKERFGNELLISQAIISSLRDGQQVKSASELRVLADELTNSNIVLGRLDSAQEVESQRFIASVVDRLQSFQKGKWKKIAMEMKRKEGRYPGFGRLVTFVRDEADSALDPVYGETGLLKFGRVKFNQPTNSQASGSGSSQPRGQQRSQSSSFTSSEGRTVCSFCDGAHRLYVCNAFKALKQEQKYSFICDKKLCENCLLDNHSVDTCRRVSMCGIGGCDKKHSRFIHWCKSQSTQNESENSQFSACSQSNVQVCIPIVDVKVNNRCDSAAMLDSCSTTTFCSSRLADKLGLEGVTVSYELSTLSNVSQTRKTKCIPNLYVESTGGQSLNLKNVYVIDNIPASESRVDVSKFEHLNSLNVTSSNTVDILIGQDNAEALVPLEVRRGGSGEPFAVRTVLGWSLHGNTSNQADVCGLVRTGRVGCKIVSNFIQAEMKVESLEDKVDRLWKIDQEGFGVQDVVMSREDDQVLKFWDQSVQQVDGHYELPIPWKHNIVVPDNFEVAQSRLVSLRRSLDRKGILARYDQEIQTLLDKGYAEEFEDFGKGVEIQNSKVWYLPHHAVITEKKPGKLRVVFDCASQYRGESLNDKCMQGPDLNNKLVHVLLRFRQHNLAIMADVEAMYYQVKVQEEDRNVLRFLWVDKLGKQVVYRMNAHIFGGVWCACIATYAMRKTLENQEEEDEYVNDVVNRSFYVDDCLRSVRSRDEAKKITEDVRKVLKTGGFNLTKFVTNDEKILEGIKEEDRAKEVKEFDYEAMSKALGVKWMVKEDVFQIKVDVEKMKNQAVTRKNMLSMIASMYDPIGLVTPCSITGKMLFQEATRMKLGWDEEVPKKLEEEWMKWIQSLEELDEVCFPRCMKPDEIEEDEGEYEIHNFSDASEKGFGCCSYLRYKGKDGNMKMSLIMSKGRVCPMKQVTIPRLELQAAMLSAQLNDVIVRELDLPIVRSYFWTDSRIVLAYIKNQKKRLKVYVANRVSTILSLTKEEQWKHITGKENPADYISRGMKPEELKKSNWENGPEINKDEVWKKEISDEIPVDDEEVKNEKITVRTEVKEHVIDEIIRRCSSWYKVKKTVAWWLKIKKKLWQRIMKKKGIMKQDYEERKEITVENMKEAEKTVMKYVQEQKFKEELRCLKTKGTVGRTSTIRSLLPIMDEDEIMCVGGRLKAMKSDEVCKHPYILPHDHEVTELIVREYHERAHQGTEWTLSMLREKFWITRSRRIIRRIMKLCVKCKKMFGRPVNQQMADLPEGRLQQQEEKKRPFAHVGIDCFGPFYVKHGRAEVKRYGCIFTCMNMRAVHIEKLNSLETDTFINAFRRFIARRGTPVKVWSDNGTNFVGGSPEILKCMRGLDKKKIGEFSLKKDVEWHFNTPHASHMGGVWERQIRTVRKILTSLLDKHADKLTDEVLETLFSEVEVMINSRPLTKMSNDVTDASTLSANQVLMMNEEMKDFPGSFSRGDMYRLRWKFVQHLANQFWRRWLREYIPELQKRTKWCSKQENIKIGDVVLLLEENTPRFLWPLGLVIEVKEGRDKLIRTVKVKTKSTVLVRPVSKVVKLEC